MVFTYLARIICIGVALTAGWAVYTNLIELFALEVSIGFAAGVALVVYCLLYFPLARHIADAVSDRLSVAMHRGRHIRVGSGLDDIPEAPKSVNCTVCGGPGGPICPKCFQRVSQTSKRSY